MDLKLQDAHRETATCQPAGLELSYRSIMQTRSFQIIFLVAALLTAIAALGSTVARAEDRAVCQNTKYRTRTAAGGWFVPCDGNGNEFALAYIEPYPPQGDDVTFRMEVDLCEEGEYLECSFSTTGFDQVTQTEAYNHYPYDHDIEQLSIYCWCKDN
jgi:hypothetical protein